MAAYPPDWRVFLVSETNLPEILAHGHYANEGALVANLNDHIRYEEPRNDGCGAFSEELDSIESQYPYEDAGFLNKTYFAISPDAGIIGILSTVQLSEDNIFTHESGFVKALAGKVSWTCSFTNSHVKYRGTEIKDIIGPLYGRYKINMGKYIADKVCKLMLEDLDDDIQNVLLISIGIDTARKRHRKNGKMTACRFLEEWTNDNEDTVMGAYDFNGFGGNIMFYLYSSDGTEFYGGELYKELKTTGSDLATIVNDGLPGNAKYANTNYTCPSGMAFNKFGAVIDEGEPYEYKPVKRRRSGGRRTRGRRRAFGRPSRRRGSN